MGTAKTNDRAVLLSLIALSESLGYAPSLREMAERLKVTVSAVQQRLVSMEKKGLVEHAFGKARALRPTPKALEWVSIGEADPEF